MPTVKPNNQAKYVELVVEDLRTRVRFPPPPPILKVPTLIGWDFFARSPSENRNDVASVASAAARFPARFPQITLSVISRDASARDAASSIFNDLQAAGSISNLVGRWGIGKRIGTVCQNSHWLPPRIPSCPLRALATQSYCSFSSFLFFDHTGIAVLPLYGIVTQRGSIVEDVSGPGSTSTQQFASVLRQALADESVSQILIDIDSPGGSVYGVAELSILIPLLCRRAS